MPRFLIAALAVLTVTTTSANFPLRGSSHPAGPTILPRQVSSACCCILTNARAGKCPEPALARRKICEI